MKNLSAWNFAWRHSIRMHFLTDRERIQLKTQHKKERDKRICDRIKAIILSDEGWTPQQIAKFLLISDQAVREHVHEYKASQKLKPESGGSEEKWSEEQSIHKWFQKLGIWPGVCSKFSNGARDHCREARLERDRIFWRKDDAVKNQLLNSFVYIFQFPAPEVYQYSNG